MRGNRTLLAVLAGELEFALHVFEDTCTCGSCGPCERSSNWELLIQQARESLP